MEKIMEYNNSICKINSRDNIIVKTAKKIIRTIQINRTIDKVLDEFEKDRFVDYTLARNIAIVYHAIKNRGINHRIGIDDIDYRGYIVKMFLGSSSVTINITLDPINPEDTDITRIDFSYNFSLSKTEEVISITRGVYHRDKSSVHRSKVIGRELSLDLKEGKIFEDIVINHIIDKVYMYLN